MSLYRSRALTCIIEFYFPRVIVARLMSAAGTGFYYTLKKPRIRERMTLRKYDPVGQFNPNLALHTNHSDVT